MLYIYILKLEKSKYYVGKTIDPNFRLNQHINGEGSYWTSIYKPVELLELIPTSDPFDEDKYTIKTMEKYGIANVRGGSFCQIKLEPSNISTIEKMLAGSTDRCYNCGMTGHFASNCTQDLNQDFESDSDSESDACYRCGRVGHYASSCYAKTTMDGYQINDESSDDEYEEMYCCEYCDKEFDTEKGALYHQRFHCKKKSNKSSRSNNCKYCFKEFDTAKGARYHEKFYCKNK